LQEVNVEKIKLERREKLVTNETLQLEQSLKNILKSGRGKGPAEMLIIARKFDEGEKQLALKNMQLRKMSTQIKMLNQLKFMQENRAQMEETGLMKKITEMPADDLEQFLEQSSVTELMQSGNIEMLSKILDTEWDVKGSFEPTAEEKTLISIMSSDVDKPLEEVRRDLENARRQEEGTYIERTQSVDTDDVEKSIL
ncbi:MAG: hypothetical protein VCE91_03355, partial [Nitrospinota bacterium]